MDRITVYMTRGLLEGLLTLAEERTPEAFEAALGVTPAAAFARSLPLADQQPVFTHFYLPDAGASVSAVFGFDLGTSPGQTEGRFVAHPDGELAVRVTDDLHAVVIVAVPPWTQQSVAAFDRSGEPLSIEIVEAEPPDDVLLG